MPNLNEFIGPKPEKILKAEMEKIIGTKPCSKCDADVDEAYWDPTLFTMTWTCPNNHLNTIKVS